MKRKWLIIGAAVIAAGIAWYFTMNDKKFFRSRSQISTGFAISREIPTGGEGNNPFEVDTRFNNAIVTFTSPTVINLLAYKLILHDLNDPKPFRKLDADQLKSPEYATVDKARAAQLFQQKLDVMKPLNSYEPEEKKLLEFLGVYGYNYKYIGQGLNVYRLERTDYIQVDYVSENPELSAFVVNNLFEQFNRYNTFVRRNNTDESLDTLKSIMDRKEAFLNEKRKEYLEQGGTVDLDLIGGSKLDQITSTQQELNAEQSHLINLQADLDKVNLKIKSITARNAIPKQGSSNNTELILLRKERDQAYKDYQNSNQDPALYAKYRRLQAEYVKKYGESGTSTSTAKPKDDELDDLNDQKNGFAIDIEASNRKVRQLQAKIGALQGGVNSASRTDAKNQGLKEELDLATKDFQEAQKRFNDGQSVGGSSLNNFKQVMFGQPAIEPEPSKRKMIVGMSGVSAALAVMLVIVLLVYLDSSTKTPGIFNKALGLKMISMVNFMNLKNKRLEDIITQVETTGDPGDNRNNVFRESLRKLRYEIESSGKKIFLFTSTKKGQGKTTLIQALSFSLSLSKKKILIIDTNFCNPDLTAQLDAKPVLEKISAHDENGKERSFLDQIRSSAVAVSHHSGSVFAIGSEGGDYTPSEVLPKENILHHLDDLKLEYDYIFLEGPPLNDFSDSKELATYVEGVVGVFSATDMIKQIDKESVKFYRDLDGKFIGAILNMVDLNNVNVA